MMTFIVNEEENLKRLDTFLVDRKLKKSRAYYQKVIENGLVTVNGKTAKASFKVKTGDTVSYEELEEVALNMEAEKVKLDVKYEDENLLVVNKPRGMVVHPSNGHFNGGTLVNALLYHCHDLSSINGVIRPGIVHRIDKDTSGLLVVAKNDFTHVFLQNQLKDKTMYREYMALVEGIIPHDKIDIIAPIGKDKNDRMRQAVDIVNGKEAITHIQVIERFNNYTLVSCRLETGRTHQIRVHLQYINHPCVGDKVYGSRKQELTQEGQMLSAIKLSFIHPITNERMTCTCDIDDEFKRVLQKIKEQHL